MEYTLERCVEPADSHPSALISFRDSSSSEFVTRMLQETFDNL